jgi:hypothetical protein
MSPAAEGANIAQRFFGGQLFGQANRIPAQRIRALFPDAPEVADDFMRQVAGEARISHTTGRIAGARPSRVLQAGEEALEGPPLPAARAKVSLTLLGAGREAVERARRGWTNEVSDELAVLYSKGLERPGELIAFLESLRAAGATLGRRSTAAGIVTAAAGEAVGQIRVR